ncbi:MAG TPA: hypothetical protein VMQ52_03300 [Candidatus Saccharimonadales bacterium]|nr:hypothetical protein [Candidatus Saccharimonadales bacterium]
MPKFLATTGIPSGFIRGALSPPPWALMAGSSSFKVTRHLLPVEKPKGMLSLSVSGNINERLRVINEFIGVFGHPAVGDFYPSIDHIDMVAWVTNR